MAGCTHIMIPPSYGDQDLKYLYDIITDPAIGIEAALRILDLNQKVPLYRKYLAITKIAKLNPTVSKLQDILNIYFERLNSLSKSDLHEILSQILLEMSKDDKACLQSDSDQHARHQIPVSENSEIQLAFMKKLDRAIRDKDKIKALLSDDMTVSWSEKWRSVSSLVRSNPSFSRTRELLRKYVKILKKTSEIEYLRLKAKFGATLDPLEKEIWECKKKSERNEERAVEARIVAVEDRALVSESPKEPDDLSIILLLTFSLKFHMSVPILSGGPVYSCLGFAIYFGIVMILRYSIKYCIYRFMR